MQTENGYMIQLSKIVLFFCLIGAFSGLAGCSKPETPPVKPEIVRKKIIINTGESVKTGPVSVTLPENSGAPPLKSGSGNNTSLLPVSSQKQLPDGGVRTDAIPGKPSPESPNPLIGQVASISAGGGYAPEGKIDPFVPLMKDDPLKVLPDAKKREPTTPLERVDLSQLKLTAIIRTPSGFKAMVEENTGKGYIVTVGTYVGTHSGKVTTILKDRIVVEEEVEDALGNVANRNSELKFQKPSGEL
jgi:type IV pilus assembly protein PilP